MVRWVKPEDCDPPHEVRKFERIWPLAEAFKKQGFDKSKPALIGYVVDGRIQLLSGTHRHMAADLVGIKIPVTLWLGSDIQKSWGTLEEWKKVMADIPVAKLERYPLD